jgi:hypothetical protein
MGFVAVPSVELQVEKVIDLARIFLTQLMEYLQYLIYFADRLMFDIMALMLFQ